MHPDRVVPAECACGVPAECACGVCLRSVPADLCDYLTATTPHSLALLPFTPCSRRYQAASAVCETLAQKISQSVVAEDDPSCTLLVRRAGMVHT